MERRGHRRRRAEQRLRLERGGAAGRQLHAADLGRLERHGHVDEHLAGQTRHDRAQRVGVRGVGHGQDDDVGGARGRDVVGAFDAAVAGGDELGGAGARLVAVARADDDGVPGARPANRQAAAFLARASDDCDAHGAQPYARTRRRESRDSLVASGSRWSRCRACRWSAAATIWRRWRWRALDRAQLTLRDGDVLVVTSKVVSRAEGRFVDLPTVAAVAARARAGRARRARIARLVELILRESTARVARGQGRAVVRHRLGFVVGQRRHRLQQRRAARRRGRLAGRGRCSCPRRPTPPRARCATAAGGERRAHRRRHQRLVRPPLPPRHRRRGHRLRRPAAAVGSARRARSARARAREHHHRAGRSGGRRRRSRRRPGRRGAPAGARARAALFAAPTSPARALCRTARRGSLRMKSRAWSRSPAASAAPASSTASRARCRRARSPPSSTPATTSCTSGSPSAPISTRSCTRSPRVGDEERGWGLAGETFAALEMVRALRRPRLVRARRSRSGDAPSAHRGAAPPASR